MELSNMPFNIPYLEVPITHKCVLRCDGCSAYSNYGLKDIVSRADYKKWISEWSKRITPKFVRILGGEPFLHDELLPIIIDTREIWPESVIEVCSNGLVIQKHPKIDDIWEWMKKLDIHLHISIHADTKKYQEKIEPILNYLDMIMKEYGLRMTYGDNVNNWSRFYKGYGDTMEPFEDGNIFASYNRCHMNYCVNLVDNELYPCPAISNLKKIINRVELNKKWDKYLNYKGLDVLCTQSQLEAFFDNKSAMDICGMCPEYPKQYKKDIGL